MCTQLIYLYYIDVLSNIDGNNKVKIKAEKNTSNRRDTYLTSHFSSKSFLSQIQNVKYIDSCIVYTLHFLLCVCEQNQKHSS